MSFWRKNNAACNLIFSVKTMDPPTVVDLSLNLCVVLCYSVQQEKKLCWYIPALWRPKEHSFGPYWGNGNLWICLTYTSGAFLVHMLKTQCKCILTEEGDDSQFLLSVVLHVLHADFTADLTEMSEINKKPQDTLKCAQIYSTAWHGCSGKPFH